MTSLLEVRNLSVHYVTRKGAVPAASGVSFHLNQGEILGIAGESGCGKTTLGFSLLRLLPENARIVEGEVLYQGTNLLRLSGEGMRKVRWNDISMVFQSSMNSLNPVLPISTQLTEAIQEHDGLDARAAEERSVRLLSLVGLEEALLKKFPHQLSGGMKQRVCIAMALACKPKIIIADEPTTALDVVVQHQILKELHRLVRDEKMSLIFISHDLSVISQLSDKVLIMYAGRVMEFGETKTVLGKPLHPYTQALLKSIPTLAGQGGPACASTADREEDAVQPIPGEPPNLLSYPSGCPFHPRCAMAEQKCSEAAPLYEESEPGRFTACHLVKPQTGQTNAHD